MRRIANRSLGVGIALIRLLWQDGGQRTARRNAWHAMTAGSGAIHS